MMRWDECSEQDKRLICNGAGPAYLPGFIRRFVTKVLSFYFDEASWDHHDYGYFWGCPSKAECDRRFLSAMLRDASKQPTIALRLVARLISFLLWYIVATQGNYSYNWLGPEYAKVRLDCMRRGRKTTRD